MTALRGADLVAPREAGPVPGSTSPGNRWALGLLGLAVVGFLAFAARTIPAPFGDSHDGRNAGVWVAGSRSLLERGPVRSRLGARSPEKGIYANHPPLIYLETALSDAVGDNMPAASRAPAWLGSLVALGLLTVLLLDGGLRPVAAGVAVVVVASTPMFLVYGSMLDTPVTSLPLGLALLVVWERARRGRRVPWPIAATLAVLAVLSGWQSLLVAAVVGGWALVQLLRRSGSRTTNLALGGGALLGAALLVAWLFWAFGGTVDPLLAQFGLRTGQVAVGNQGPLLATIRDDTATMFGAVAVLAIAGLVVALVDRRTRGLAAIALLVTVPYPLVFRSGALNHDYWNFWFLLPFCVGLGAGVDRLLRSWRSLPWRDIGMAAIAGSFAILATVGLWARPDGAEWAILEGARAGTIAQSMALDRTQQSAWYTGAIGQPAGWLALATRRPAVAVPVTNLPVLAAAHPDDVVFVGRMRCIGGEPQISYAYERAADVAARPPQVDRC